MSKYTNTPHQTIEQICSTAQRRVAAGERAADVVSDLVEGYDLGWGSANAQAIEQAAGTYTPDDAPAPDKAARIAAYEAKREAKVERLEAAADAHSNTSNHLHDRAHKMAEVIPLGQPILVGHHSERGDRAYRGRISSTFEKAHEEHEKAQYYARRAASASSNRAIYSDDPAADDKLKAKIANAEQLQEIMKACNAAIRKHAKAGPAAQIAALVALGRPEAQAAELIKPDFCGRIGFADYQLTNNNANIRRMKERLQHVTTAHTRNPGRRRQCPLRRLPAR
jgi:hypothetical protein